MPHELNKVTLAVLAGGEGSRMGGPKAWLEVGGRPILAYLLERWEWRGPTMVVTSPGRERPPGAELFGREVVDPVAGLGPLRGVLTALESAETELVVVTTVDMPGIGIEQIRAVVDAMEENALGAAFVREGAIEPFPLAIRRSAREIVAARLAENRRSVQGLFEDERFRWVSPPAWGDEVWVNLNTPVDWERFVARTGKL